VTHVVAEGPGLTSVYLSGRHLDRLPVRAGQFFLWRFLDGPGWSRAQPYTLSAAPRTGLLRITVKDLGDGSSRAARLRPGTKVIVEGPYGVLTAARRARPKALLMAAGVGITTMRALLDDLPGDITLLYRVRSAHDAVFRAELEQYTQVRGVRVVYLEGSRPPRPSWLPAQYAHLRDADTLRALVPDAAEREAYLCGPADWMAAACASLAQVGVAAANVHTEEFAW
jgi:ferredoxin-NADP reductase